jgi:hypothetical protein
MITQRMIEAGVFEFEDRLCGCDWYGFDPKDLVTDIYQAMIEVKQAEALKAYKGTHDLPGERSATNGN